MSWLWLFIAGLLEAVWVIGLKRTEGFTRLWPSVITVAAMVASFFLLSHALKTIPVGTGYAVWTGIGVLAAAVFGMVFLDEPRGVARIVCLTLILTGMVGLKLVDAATEPAAQDPSESRSE